MLSERVALVALLALGALPGRARAHDVRTSALDLDLETGRVEGTLRLPVDQLGLALATEWGDGSWAELPQHPERIDGPFQERFGGYLERYVTLDDGRGARWPLTVGDARWAEEDDQPVLVVPLLFVAPDGAAPRSLTVRVEAVAEEVVTHRTLVSIGRDFERGHLETTPRPLAVLRYGRREVTLDRRGASIWQGLAAYGDVVARHPAVPVGLGLLALLLILRPLRRRVGAATPSRPR